MSKNIFSLISKVSNKHRLKLKIYLGELLWQYGNPFYNRILSVALIITNEIEYRLPGFFGFSQLMT